MRIVKDCGAGDPKLTFDLLKEDGDTPSLNYTGHKNKLEPIDSKKNLINPPQDSVLHHPENVAVVENMNKSLGKGVLPNIIGKKMTVGDVMSLGALDKPIDR